MDPDDLTGVYALAAIWLLVALATMAAAATYLAIGYAP